MGLVLAFFYNQTRINERQANETCLYPHIHSFTSPKTRKANRTIRMLVSSKTKDLETHQKPNKAFIKANIRGKLKVALPPIPQ